MRDKVERNIRGMAITLLTAGAIGTATMFVQALYDIEFAKAEVSKEKTLNAQRYIELTRRLDKIDNKLDHLILKSRRK